MDFSKTRVVIDSLLKTSYDPDNKLSPLNFVLYTNWYKQICSLIFKYKIEEFIRYLKIGEYINRVKERTDIHPNASDLSIYESKENLNFILFICYTLGYNYKKQNMLKIFIAIPMFYADNYSFFSSLKCNKNCLVQDYEILSYFVRNNLFNNSNKFLGIPHSVISLYSYSCSDLFLDSEMTSDRIKCLTKDAYNSIGLIRCNLVVYDNEFYLWESVTPKYVVLRKIRRDVAMDVINYTHIFNAKKIPFAYFLNVANINKELCFKMPVKSFGFQEWKILLSINPELRTKLTEAELSKKNWVDLYKRFPFIIEYLPLCRFNVNDWKKIF